MSRGQGSRGRVRFGSLARFGRRRIRRGGAVRSALRRPGRPVPQGDDGLARGAALLRPGPRLPVRVQPRRGRSARSARAGRSTRSARWPSGASRSPNGPHINNPVVPEDRAKAAWEALKQAQAAAAGASPVEQALIEAARLALRPSPARGPQAARAGLRRRHAQGLEGLPEGRRRRRALRGVPRRPAALGPLDAGREAAAGTDGARRDARVRARPRPEAPPRQPPHDPRGRGLAPPGEGGPGRRHAAATCSPASATWSTCRRTSTSAAAAGSRRSTRTPRPWRPTAATRHARPTRASTGSTWPTTTTC